MITSSEQDKRPVAFDVPFVIRGRIVDDCTMEHASRAGFAFRTPDAAVHAPDVPLRSTRELADLDRLSLDEIVDFLVTLGERLALDRNPFMQEAFELSLRSSRLSPQVLRTIFESQIEYFFRRDLLLEAAQRRVGVSATDRWVAESGVEGRNVRIRPFGSRILHIVAGNSPGVSAITVARSALTRSDAIIKAPSNDPMTAIAIARTMAELDPEHPITRHTSVLYWRGGDSSVERALLSATAIDKVVAWGGGEVIEHVARSVGAGVEIIGLGPKRSASLLGRESLSSPEGMRDGASRLARDVGLFDQEGCVNSRVAYVDTTDIDDADEALRAFAVRVHDALLALPEAYSGPAEHLPPALHDELRTAKLFGTPEIIGGTPAGGVVLSSDSRPVDFAPLLAARHVNLVPVKGFDSVIDGFSTVTQTVGVYPASLRVDLREELGRAGVHRVVDLGHAVNLFGNQTLPQDGIEVLRRMCRWVVDEEGSSDGIGRPT